MTEPLSTSNLARIKSMLDTTHVGVGTCIAHHGEILQGMFDDDGGTARRALVTLPCPHFHSTAKYLPYPSGPLYVAPANRRKTHRAAELALERFGGGITGGSVFLASDIPEGWGMGSSTSDVVATIRAVADAFDAELTPALVAELSILAEVASDSIMFEGHAILFAQRDGIVLEDFGKPITGIEVLGFDTDPYHGGVDTLLLPPAAYTWEDVESFRPLRGLLRSAIAAGDVRGVGRVATASARINQRFLPKPHFDDLLGIVDATGGIGLQVAHSGTVAGILFDAAGKNLSDQLARAMTHLERLGFGPCHHFRAGEGDVK